MLGSLVRQALRASATASQLRAPALEALAKSSCGSGLADQVYSFDPSANFLFVPSVQWQLVLRNAQQAAFSAAAAKKRQPKGADAKFEAQEGEAVAAGDAAEQDTAAEVQQAAEEISASAAAAETERTAAQAAGAAVKPELTAEQLQEQLLQRDEMLLEKDGQIEEVTERSLRALADLENIRDRSARQAETTRKFAVQGFAKALLEVADNLERALSSAPEDEQHLSADKALVQLRSLRDGLQLTNRVLMQVFEQNGLVRYEALGEKFDPNLHSALFEMPDPARPAGSVAAVTKAGYKLHDRVLRPAEVGVVAARSHNNAGSDSSEAS